MTADEFRRLALKVSGAVESSHVNHPDFRIEGRVFATLGYPDDRHGMVKLTPVLQRAFMKRAPSVFGPAAGAWGKKGSTTILLAAARVGIVRDALDAAAKIVISGKKKA